MSKPAGDDINPELEKIPEPAEENADVLHNDPPPPDHETCTEQEAALMDLGDNQTSPVWASTNPASPAKVVAASTEDATITGFGHTTLGEPVALSKHNTKEEIAGMDKGKWSTDLSSYAHLSAQDLHSGYLNRLYTSHDYEAGLVNLMKELYELNFCFNFCNIISA